MIKGLLGSRLAGIAATAALAASMLAGCSAAATPAPAAGISVTGAWARASSMMASAGALYAVVKNTGTAADALIGAESSVAATVEVHETYMMEATPAASDGGMHMGSPKASGGTNMGSGAMGMRPIARVEVPAGGSLELKPGSYHVMLIGLKQELKAGEKITVTLVFEKAGKITVEAEVRAST